MGSYTRTYSLTDGTTAYGSQVAFELDALGSSVNNITNSQISSGAAITDSKLAQITTASKVSGAALTSLSSIPAGAGIIPSANISITPVFENKLLHIRDERATNTAGENSVGAAYTKRTLQTTKTNEISGASLASSVITLPSGTYYIEAYCYAYGGNNGHIRLRNTSDSTTALVGLNTNPRQSGSDTLTTAITSLRGRFTIAAQKNFEIQHYVETTSASNGFGLPVNDGAEVEVYADVQIWKVL